MAENPVEKAVKEAEAACQAAITSTPMSYWPFIIFLTQRKRVGGTRQQPIYATIRTPYMGVDGRVRMAMDEHREVGASLTITSHFEEVFGKQMCKCTVMSALHGTRTGWAQVNIGGSGVDETNPLENAETSAIGRALGFMGYGLFGTGVTSIDEIMSQDMTQDTPIPSARPSPDGIGVSASQSSDRPEAIEPASDKQLGFLYSLMKNVGIEEGNKRAYIGFMYPQGMGKRACSEAIETLKDRGEMPGGWQTHYFNFLVRHQGIDRQRIVDKMMAICRHSEPEKLTTSDFVLVTQALKTNATDAPAPVLDETDDLPLQSPVPAQSFGAWLDAISKDCRVELKVVEAWVIEKYGPIDSAKKQNEIYEQVRAMDLGAIKNELKLPV